MNMDLRTLADRIGIAEYPEELTPVYEGIRGGEWIEDIEKTLEALHTEFAPFGEYYETVVRGARELQEKEELLAWLALGVTYCKDAEEGAAARFPIPPCDGSVARDMFPVILIALEYPETVKRYRARGFDDAQIKKNLGNLAENIRVHALTEGRVALSQGLYGWMTHYTKARIFDHMGFNFQAWKWKDEALLLRHRESGEHVFLLLKGSFTAEGLLAGLRGAEDVPAAFDATVEETEDAFCGYRAVGQRVRTERECFPKSEWEAVMRPGDDVINFHIPRGANFDSAHLEKSMEEGEALTRRYYPECDFKKIVCTSWMLDPKLLDILPEGSKIAYFIRHFILHPSMDNAGVACMGYVWPGIDLPTEELPENTSLQRGIKKMMLGGSYTYWTSGAWI